MAEQIVEGKLEAIEKKANPRGGNYLRAKIGNRHYSVFGPDEHAAIEEAIGKRVRIRTVTEEKEGKTYDNYVPGSFEKLGDAPVEKSVPDMGKAGSPETMTKADWAAKDYRITRTAIAKSCIEAGKNPNWGPDDWLAWALGVPQKGAENPPVDTAEPIERETSQEGALESVPDDYVPTDRDLLGAPAPIIEGIKTVMDLYKWAAGPPWKMTSSGVHRFTGKTGAELAKLDSQALNEIAIEIAFTRGK